MSISDRRRTYYCVPSILLKWLVIEYVEELDREGNWKTLTHKGIAECSCEADAKNIVSALEKTKKSY